MAGETAIITSAKQSFNLVNFGTCFFLALGSMVYGYFAGIIGTTLTKPSFLKYMSLIDDEGNPTSNSAGLIGATTGVFQAGGVFGIILCGYLTDRIGRKRTSIAVAALSVISSALISASQNIAMFIAMRFFTGAAGFAFLTVLCVYCAELAPAALRGLYIGFNGALCAMGFALATYFGVAFFYVPDEVQWRAPFALGTVLPIILTVGYVFVPESPRHLLMEGKREASFKVMMSQHGRNGHDDFARAEFYQMERQAELDMDQDASWKSFFNKKSIRQRAMIVSGVAFLSQSTGNLVINAYAQSIFSSLGYDAYSQLCLQAGYITLVPIFNGIGALFADRVGRRILMFIGFTGCLGCVVIEAAMVALYSEEGTNKAGLGTGAAMIFLFGAFYATCGDISVFIIVGEIFPNHLRAKGSIVAYTANALTNLVYLQVAPTAFDNIGWKFYLVFIVITSVGLVWVYFCVPETKGIALEELPALFGETVAVRAADITIEKHEIHVDSHTQALELEDITDVADDAGHKE